MARGDGGERGGVVVVPPSPPKERAGVLSRTDGAPPLPFRVESRNGRQVPPEAQHNLCGQPRHGRLSPCPKACPPPGAPEEPSPSSSDRQPPPCPAPNRAQTHGQHLTLHPPAPPQLPACGSQSCRPGEDAAVVVSGGEKGRQGLGRGSRWRPAAGAEKPRGLQGRPGGCQGRRREEGAR